MSEFRSNSDFISQLAKLLEDNNRGTLTAGTSSDAAAGTIGKPKTVFMTIKRCMY
jgi:hypothetical protein